MLTKGVGVEICILCLLTACSAAPPTRHVVSHDPMLARQDGVLLLADVCVQKDAVGDDEDFFVVAESKSAARILLKALRTYIEDSNIPIRGEQMVVCAARHGSAQDILVGDNFNAQSYRAPQPLYVQENIEDDKQYINALRNISTYAFERAAIDRTEDTSVKQNQINKITFLNSADIVKNRTNASSILFLGALGTSRTGAKAVAEGVSSFFVGMATGLLTAGLGTDYYVMFTPGQQVSGRFMEGALIDLESGELTWSNAVKAGGDPIEAETWLETHSLDLLFHDLLFKRTSNQ